MPNTDEKTTEKKLSFKKRVNPKSSDLRKLTYYKTPNPFAVGPSGGNCTWYAWGRFWEVWAQGDSRYKKQMPKTVCRQNACYFFSDGKKNGFGIQRWTDGSIFFGTFVKNIVKIGLK